MTVRIINEKFEEVPLGDTSGLSVYSSFILPQLFYLNLKRDITILWYENLKDSVIVPRDHPDWHPPIDFNKINESDVDVVIILWCDHPWPADGNFVEDIIDKINKPCIFLSWTEFMPRVKSVFYPFWAMAYPMSWGARIPSAEAVRNSNREYIFSSITARHQYDRLVNLTAMLMHDNLFSQHHSIINFPATSHHSFGFIGEQGVDDLLRPDWPEAADFFKTQVTQMLPIHHSAMPYIDFSNSDYHNETMSVVIPAYTNAYVNITAETSDSQPFISEKSMKPILAGQLFVTIAPPGTLDTLCRMGFDVFDDIFEHNRYSEYPNVNHRIRALHLRLQQLGHRDWEKIYVDTAERRLNNRNYLLSGYLARHKREQLEEMINGFI